MKEPVNIPEKFKENMSGILDKESMVKFFESIDKPVVSSIRLNPAKCKNPLFNGNPVPWCDNGFLLNNRPSFIADPMFHAGAYYVQESSSMFLDTIMKTLMQSLPSNPIIVDICASPGGKSTLLAGVLNDHGLLICNEVIKSRVTTLQENITKWGYSNTLVTNNDPREFGKIGELFDVVVTDAPCSGEGMFRKDVTAIKEWNEELVDLCAARQSRILDDMVKCIRPGGFLIYSTCTFNHKENEEQVLRLMNAYGMESVFIPYKGDGPIIVNEYNGIPLHAFRFMFHRVSGEGLFMAVLRKPGNGESKLRGKKIDSFNESKGWLRNPEKYTFIKEKESINAIPIEAAEAITFLRKNLKVVSMGIEMGELKKNDLIPAHALALSNDLSNEVIRTELPLQECRKYLMREAPDRKYFSADGWQVVTYNHLPLGWVKVLPNRVNNYFPTHLRVLKNILNEDSQNIG